MSRENHWVRDGGWDGGSHRLSNWRSTSSRPSHCVAPHTSNPPEKYSKPTCGLINIKTEVEECLKWCMKYHQSDKAKHADRTTVLNNINAKYNYDGMVFPADYTSITVFEKLNKVCIFTYEIDEGKLRLSKAGKIEYLTLDLVYLLWIENEENLITYLYIYIEQLAPVQPEHRNKRQGQSILP